MSASAMMRVRPVGWHKLSSQKPSFIHLLDVDDWYDEFEGVPKALCSARNQSDAFFPTKELAGRPLCQSCLELVLRASAALEDGRPFASALGATVVIGGSHRRERRLLDPAILALLADYLEGRVEPVPLGRRQRLSSLAA